jgi:hypothetical protein
MGPSNYHRVGVGDLTEAFNDLFKSENEIVTDSYNEIQKSCLPGYRFDVATDGCVAGSASCIPNKEYWDSATRRCVPYPAARICPVGQWSQPSGTGTFACVPIQAGEGGSAVSAGGGLTDFFSKLFGGGQAEAAPPASSGGTVTPSSTTVGPLLPGTNTPLPTYVPPPSVVTGASDTSDASKTLLIIGGMGLAVGVAWYVTR